MALTKVIGNGLGTLGDGTANDTKIVFDGNAQDYHIGLDDSSDKLVIGKGTALGTTTSMSFDENGIILKPLQPAFLVQASDVSNMGDNTTIVFGTEIFDQNADFDTSTYTFTAPVTGRYQLSLLARYNSLDSGASYYQGYVVTSNRSYIHTIDPNYTADLNYYSFGFSFLADMDANDTAYILYNQSGGTQQTNISAGGDTYFSGYLVA